MICLFDQRNYFDLGIGFRPLNSTFILGRVCFKSRVLGIPFREGEDIVGWFF